MSTQEYINSENINIALEYTILSYHIFHAGEHERVEKVATIFLLKLNEYGLVKNVGFSMIL